MSRAQRIAAACTDADAVIISNGTSPFLDSVFWYVTEQTSGTFEGSLAIISKDGGLDVLTGSLEGTTARRGLGNVRVYETREERDSIFKELLKGCTRIGLGGRATTYSASEYIKKMTGAELVDMSLKIADVISVKDKKEIADIRKACAISSRTASKIPELLHPGITEKQAAWLIDSDMRVNGGSGNAFETIAAFGAHSAEPHHRPSDHKLKKGDTALFDFGSKYDMYSSDMTRTVFLGEPDDVLKRAYAVVQKAKAAGMDEMRDGAPAKDADIAARNIIDESEFKGKFIHSFGHGIGMNVHEGPSVSYRSEDILKEGMIVSAEPGIYIPGIGGIRIEDTVLITKDGAEPLTRFDQNYTVI
ncbi:MAG: aminopeptidase P family protein [Methanomassiliicoccaceae archaeon]|jgi:Xaa-Pro dipeptidase|nr:aminopeptidase P family protein [Methanomassiliicoccaceae archaeon]